MAIKLWVNLVDGNDSSGLGIPSLEFVNPIVNVCYTRSTLPRNFMPTRILFVLLHLSDMFAKSPPALFSISDLKWDFWMSLLVKKLFFS